MPTLKKTFAGEARTMDVRPDRLDLRDLPYRPSVRNLPAKYPTDNEIKKILPTYVEAGFILNQGDEGACTGYGLACVVNYLLWRNSDLTNTEHVSPHMLYELARFYDEWPGESYSGSSCRGALKGWHKHGVCTRNRWPKGAPSKDKPLKSGWALDAAQRRLGVYYRIDKNSVVDMQAAIHETGAIYVSGNIHGGWSLMGKRPSPTTHAEIVIIENMPRTKDDGTHAFALVGYNTEGFIVQNSWGTRWGCGGFAILTYEDWVANGQDAWALALGVPSGSNVSVPSAYVRSTKKFITGPAGAGGISISTGGADAVAPNGMSNDECYRHALVTGNDGRLIRRLIEAGDAEHAASLVLHDYPTQWFERNASAAQEWNVAVYAHGGLNSEEPAVKRIGVLAPIFKDHGIYPIFNVWKSGALETLRDILSDKAKEVFGAAPPARGLGEAWDRLLESVCHDFVVRSLWSQMKQNVDAATSHGHGLALMVRELSRLSDTAQAAGKTLHVHLVGHSAGSFIVGHLLSSLQRVSSVSLMAPACDIRFANTHFAPALSGVKLERNRFQVHVLSEKNEMDDSVGPYRKSLLHLVSRGLEADHKTPLLGLAGAFENDPTHEDAWHDAWIQDVQTWQQAFWAGDARVASARGYFVETRQQVETGNRAINASHGSFDNSQAAMSLVLKNILPNEPIGALGNLEEA